ncbi:MAG TPA: cytidine deaminase [Firmicutes bacterium]|nr:cytidine deaminase [Bacillota bacterium]HAV20142.1 cytidine deaminase [Bacillota bacterium]
MKKGDLIIEAGVARDRAYAPYSKFKVGAAVFTKDGKVFHGANVENASYGLSMCAERNAIYHAMMNGYKKDDFIGLAVIGDTKKPIAPCGACRQVISELFPRDGIILLANLKGEIVERTVDSLLPEAFTPADL